jgi:feruloyl-CoA synthase
VSPAYSLLGRDFDRLAHVLGALRPGLVFAADGARFGRAVDAVADRLAGATLATAGTPFPGRATTSFHELVETAPSARVDEAFAAVGPDTVAKLLFTSGSSDEPKAVVNTQRMLCSNQKALSLLWPFLAARPPVLLDWLPWHHTFGGNQSFNLVLEHGGTLYIDDGKPTSEGIGRTVANLRAIAPTVYFNVPRGFDMLIPYLERDEELRASFFGDLELLFYAGAGLAQSSWDRLDALARATLGQRVVIVSGWGATETAPMVTVGHFDVPAAGVIGLPGPGCELKLCPRPGEDRYEARVRGPNVTPGYLGRPDLTRAAFDEEGFFRTGDAVRFVDPAEPDAGLAYDGRLAEDFKLSSGTWVQVGALRLRALAACAPVAQDVVVTGHDREEIGLLVFASLEGCRGLCPDGGTASLTALVERPEVRARLAAALRALAAEATGSARRPTRALLLPEGPSLEAGEITDKGYVNQRVALRRRAALVELLYAEPRPDAVITLEEGT